MSPVQWPFTGLRAAQPGGVGAVAGAVGVSLGDADVEDGDYFGVPVVEASVCAPRLRVGRSWSPMWCGHWPGRGAGSSLSRLAGWSSTVSTQPGGGVPGGVDTPRRVSRDLAVPLPGRVLSAVAATFVGRGAERETLDAALKASPPGRRGRCWSRANRDRQDVVVLGVRKGRIRWWRGRALRGCDEDLGIP